MPPVRRPSIEQLEDRLLLARPLGIDVYSGDGNPTWSTVKANGYTFGWIKATEGFTFNDSNFSTSIQNAHAAGMLVAGYHYARYDNNTASAEVTHYLNIAGSYITAGYLAPMLDVEEPNNPLSRTQTSQWVNDWCNGILSATGVRPIVYTYIDYANNHLDSTVTQWPLWMANYNGQDPQTGAPGSTSPWSSWNFWQYSSTGSVPGVPSTNCDKDTFNGTAAQLNSWIIMASPTTPTGPT